MIQQKDYVSFNPNTLFGGDCYKYLYAMIKPDGAKYIEDAIYLIDKNVESDQIYFFLINNWKEVATEIYDAKREWTPNYFATFTGYANTLIELFGNYALVILLKVKENNYKESLWNLAKVKKQIRGFRDGSFAFVTNAVYLDEFRTKKLPTTTLKIVFEDGSEKEPFYIDNVGFHDCQAFNIIHTPDAKESSVLRELSILKEFNVFKKTNEISPIHYEWIDIASKYQSMAMIDYLRRKENDIKI